MKKKIKEPHKLPLNFKYIDFIKSKVIIKNASEIRYFISCDTYATDYLEKTKPNKAITRLL
jgi:hypothetical protein